MDQTQRCTGRKPRLTIGRFASLGLAPLLLAFTLVPACRADSTLRAASLGGGSVTASAHLDFRITVLPSLALAAHASTVLVQGNSGGVTLERSQTSDADGRTPGPSMQLRATRQVIDTALNASTFGGSSLITAASP